MISWTYLVAAGLLEIGWPVGLKIAETPNRRVFGVAIAAFFLIASGILLFLAQQTIPIGTAYAVWTGIGAAGTFLVGLVFYRDPASLGRYAGVLLIVSGVVVLKVAG